MLSKRTILIVIFVWMHVCSTLAQKKKQMETNPMIDTALIVNAINQSVILGRTNLDSALDLSKTAIVKSNNLGWFRGMALSNEIHADQLLSRKRHKEAIRYYYNAIDALFEVEPKFKNGEPQVGNFIKGNFFDTPRIISVMLKLSDCLNHTKQFTETELILDSALTFAINFKDESLITAVKEAKCFMYEISNDKVKAIDHRNSLGAYYLEKKNLKSAVEQYERAGNLSLLQEDTNQALAFYSKITTLLGGRNYVKKDAEIRQRIHEIKNMQKGKKKRKKSLLDEPDVQEVVYDTLTYPEISEEDLVENEYQNEKEKNIVERKIAIIEQKKRDKHNLYEKARRKHDFKYAYIISNQIASYDSVLIAYEKENVSNNYSDFKMNLLKLRYDKRELERLSREKIIDKEKRDYINKINAQEIEKNRIANKYLTVILGLVILGAFISFIVYKKRKDAEARVKINTAKIEMKALRAQMNPHFIFNALQSIQTFLIQHKEEKANEYLIKFSKLMRMVLENSQYADITLDNEISTLNLYMELESIRLKFPFTHEFQIDQSVNIDSDRIPPLILQPIIENSIWHGFQYKNGPGHIQIKVFIEGEKLVVTVEDNGIGRTERKQLVNPLLEKKDSLGTKLIGERLKILDETHGITTSFIIQDLFDKDGKPSGTKVTLKLPHLS